MIFFSMKSTKDNGQKLSLPTKPTIQKFNINDENFLIMLTEIIDSNLVDKNSLYSIAFAQYNNDADPCYVNGQHDGG